MTFTAHKMGNKNCVKFLPLCVFSFMLNSVCDIRLTSNKKRICFGNGRKNFNTQGHMSVA